MATHPDRLYRVEWYAAVGWPEPERRQSTARNFATALAAGRQLAIIAAMPSHLELIDVLVTECDWQPVDPATLPHPEGESDDE